MAVCTTACPEPDDSNQPRNDVREAEAAHGGPAPAGNAASMAELVTRHAQITEREIGETWDVLAVGYDSLDLSLHVSWNDWETLSEKLDEGKMGAAGNDRAVFCESDVGTVLIYPSGSRMYRFHLATANFHFWIAMRESSKGRPNVRVSLGSQTLWFNGVLGAVEEVHSLIRELGGSTSRTEVSRVDLCTDVHLPCGLSSSFVKSHQVCRSGALRIFETDDKLETIYFGKSSGDIQARVYDKSTEMIVSGKLWLFDVWGREPESNVWRIEFQIRRNWLRGRGIASVDDLINHGGAIWSHLTTEWLSLRHPDACNTSRRELHPFWETVQAVASKLGDVGPLERLPDQRCHPKFEWYVSHIAGCLPTYASLLGKGRIDDVLSELRRDLAKNWEDRGGFDNAVRTRATELGIRLDTEGADDVPI